MSTKLAGQEDPPFAGQEDLPGATAAAGVPLVIGLAEAQTLYNLVTCYQRSLVESRLPESVRRTQAIANSGQLAARLHELLRALGDDPPEPIPFVSAQAAGHKFVGRRPKPRG